MNARVFSGCMLVSYISVATLAGQPATKSLETAKAELAILASRNLDDSIDKLDRKIGTNPKDTVALSARGLAWHLKGENGKAVADLDIAIGLDSTNAHSYYFRALALYAKGEREKALNDLNKSMSLDEALIYRAVNKRGAIWQDKGEWGKAIDDYSESIRLNPRFVPAIVNRTYLYAGCPEDKCRDGKKAVAEATRLCEVTKWKVPRHWKVLAAAYSSVGDYDSAVKWQTKAAKYQESKSEENLTRQWLEMYKEGKPFRFKSKASSSKNISSK